MTYIPKEISNEFPQFADRLSELATRSLHFGRLCDRYATLGRRLDSAPAFAEPAEDGRMGELRRQHRALHRQIARLVEGAARH